MKIREHRVITCDNVTITVGKDEKKYRSSYTVGVYSEFFNWTMKCNNREVAKQELIKKLRIYSNLKITEIIRGLF